MRHLLIIFLHSQLVFCENCSRELFHQLKSRFDLSKPCGDTCTIEHSSSPDFNWVDICWNNKHNFLREFLCYVGEPESLVQTSNDSCQVVFLQNATTDFNTDCLKQYATATCKGVPSAIQDRFSELVDESKNFPLSLTTIHTPFLCEEDELYFKSHCYFFKFFDKTSGRHESSSVLNSTEICMEQHPDALGLAVETYGENRFVLTYSNFTESLMILSSGIKTNSTPGVWNGWNKLVDEDILNVRINLSHSKQLYYILDSSEGRWLLSDLRSTISSHKTYFYMMCERDSNPKNIDPFLLLQCLTEYRNSKCYNKKEHKKFCCAKDDNNEIWFGCPDDTAEKKYPSNLKCTWNCGADGFFSPGHPICTGRNACHVKYKNLKFSAPLNTYAITDCPNGLFGYSTWYCGAKGTFQGLPDFSLCCETKRKKCRDVDRNLKYWMACPGKTAVRNVTCPTASYRDYAIVRWHCFESGTFDKNLPDYSTCNDTELDCIARDRYGRLWEGKSGETVMKDCPESFIGVCYWNCTTSGKFETPEPDYTQCRPEWIEEVESMISNGTKHQVVMGKMDNFTKNQDLRVGFGYVLNLSSECVQLFKRQNTDGDVSVFKDFLHSYSKIFKNIAGNANVWSSFSVPDRRKYGSDLLKTTQNASFANLEIENTLTSYDVTLASFKNQGFDFFVSYNPKMIGRKFPLENYEESDWHLEIKDMNRTAGNFAAMGLAINHSLSSLMFPPENELKGMRLNSHVLTFTVAALQRSRSEVIPEVTVFLSLKHINKTRYPETKTIRRRLHVGETPSGIIKSTFCHYYEVSHWSRKGCVVTSSSKEETNCTCSHLSSIGLLMSIHEYVPNEKLEVVSIISSGISIISLLLTLVVFYVLDSVKNERLLIGKNLTFCLLLGHIMLISVMDKRFFYITDNLCTVYAIVLHYVFMAAFAWMFVEGCHLYRMLVLVFDSSIEYRWIYLLIGYGVPLVVVGSTQVAGLVFKEQPYGQDELCWLKPPNYIWAFIGPVVFTASINFVILLIAMKLAISSKMKTEKSSFSNFTIWIKGWISLSTLLGVTWLLGLAYIHYNEVCIYSFVLLNGLQGLFIFLFRCVFSDQYRAAFIQKFKSWFSGLEFSESKTSERVKTSSKLFAISQSGSKFTSETVNNDSGYDHAILNCLNDQIDIQKGILKTLDKFSESKNNSYAIGVDVEITVTPAASEEYLRRNILVRDRTASRDQSKSRDKRKSSDDFPELSYHSNHL